MALTRENLDAALAQAKQKPTELVVWAFELDQVFYWLHYHVRLAIKVCLVTTKR